MQDKASPRDCARIVARAIRALPQQRIGIHDADDLQQELMLVAMRSADRADPMRPSEQRGYVQVSVKNAIRSLIAHTLAARRYPQDRYGRPVQFAGPGVLDVQLADASCPEAQVEARERLAQIAAVLPESQRRALCEAAAGRRELAPKEIINIRYLLAGGPNDV